jgi:colicin import membrane protein
VNATTHLAHDALLPQPTGGLGSGAALALLAHLGLVLALTTAVDWRTQAPVAVSAELWSAVPLSAAPAPPATAERPPPQPTAVGPTAQPAATRPPPPAPAVKAAQPDIALEQAQARKAEVARQQARADKDRREKARLEKEQLQATLQKDQQQKDKKKQQAAAEQATREAQADEARLARQREENLQRMMGQAGSATGRAGTAAQDAAPSAAYAGRVAARIRRELVFTGNVPETAEAEVQVRSTPSGTIIGRSLTKSSGHPEWDEAVLRAIDKTGTLPRDTDGRVQTEMTLVFKRRDGAGPG